MLKKQEKRYRRCKRIRAKVKGNINRPRFCVFRSAKHIYAQLIDDEKNMTLVAVSDRELSTDVGSQNIESSKENAKVMTNRVAIAFRIGELLAEKALDRGIREVVFDRRGFKYHGRIKALADGARNKGLKF